MSKNITIKEGGTDRAFTGVSIIQTNLQDSGTQNWVPEDEAVNYVDLDELDVDENGAYFIEDYEDIDGWKVVNVNVPGGPIPEGEEIEGTATTNLELYDPVEVIKSSGTLTFITNDTQNGFVRKDKPDSNYRLVNNKYNQYNIITGDLIKAGTSTVYEATILNGGRAVCLRLTNNTGTMPADGWVGKYRFVWYDGTITDISFKYKTGSAGSGSGVYFGCSNTYIAVIYRISTGVNNNYTVDIYNKKGKIVKKGLCTLSLEWSGSSERVISDIVPLSKNKVACWYTYGNYYIDKAPAAIVEGDFKVGQGLSNHARPTVYYYRSYYYYSLNINSKYQIYKRKASDPYDNPIPVGTPLNATMGEINIFGHFQAYVEVNGETKYRLYNINSMEDVYPDVIANSQSHFLRENQKYLIFGKTYMKKSDNMIFPTGEYPVSHNNNIVLGIMKGDVKAGQEGTVIVLFT